MNKLANGLAALRQQPHTDLATLRAVEGLLHGHAGQRVTLGAGRARASRMQQAQAIAGACTSTSQAVRLIVAALGVHQATAYRYINAMKK